MSAGVSAHNSQTLSDCLKEYMAKCYEIQPNDRLFPYTKSFLNHEMLRGCKKSGVKKIRVHDLRHSHASLLIEMGCQPLLIADRLGHEKIQTTLDTYSHLYPNKQTEVAKQLENIINGTTVPCRTGTWLHFYPPAPSTSPRICT